MKRTKLLSIVFSVLLTISCFPVTVFADDTLSESDMVSIDSAIQEYDAYIAANLESLIEEQAGVEVESCSENMVLYSVETDTSYIIKDYCFTEEVCDTGTEKVMADVTLVQITDTAAVSPYSYGNDYLEGSDNTGSVTLYSTLYYRQKTVDNNLYYNFYSASGGYKSLDSGTQVVSQSVELGAAGPVLNGVYERKTINKNPAVTVNPWSYNTGFTYYWHNVSGMEMGINYTVTLKRASSTWSYTFRNAKGIK